MAEKFIKLSHFALFFYLKKIIKSRVYQDMATGHSGQTFNLAILN